MLERDLSVVCDLVGGLVSYLRSVPQWVFWPLADSGFLVLKIRTVLRFALSHSAIAVCRNESVCQIEDCERWTITSPHSQRKCPACRGVKRLCLGQSLILPVACVLGLSHKEQLWTCLFTYSKCGKFQCPLKAYPIPIRAHLWRDSNAYWQQKGRRARKTKQEKVSESSRVLKNGLEVKSLFNMVQKLYEGLCLKCIHRHDCTLVHMGLHVPESSSLKVIFCVFGH